jgi:hypothetical protein
MVDGEHGARTLGGGLLLTALLVVLLVTLLAGGGCEGDSRLAPLVVSGDAEVALGFAGGALAGTPSGTQADCPVPEPGFEETVSVRLLVEPPNGTSFERELEIPARTESGGLLLEGLTPGEGYRLAATVERTSDGELLFEGERDDVRIRPGVREIVSIDLVPTSRRVVLGIGQPRAAADDRVVVPILASHSLPLRGIQFDLCFDEAAVAVEGLEAVGRLVDFDGVASGSVPAETPLRVVLWSSDPEERLPAGSGAVVELTLRFLPGGMAATPLVFTGAIVTDQASPGQNFVVYYFDGGVER